jgi:hypothetical protein
MPQARTVEIPKRLPLYTPIQTRTSNPPFVKDSRLYNGFVEYDPEIEGYQIFKRPGLGPPTVAPATGGTFNGLGIYTETGSNIVYVNQGATPGWLNFGATPAFQGIAGPIGPFDTSAPYTFETVGGPTPSSPRYVVMQNGVRGYYITMTSGLFPRVFAFPTINQINDPNFPLSQSPAIATVPGWCYLDGFLYIMDVNGGIWGTNAPNNPVTWSATNYILASSNADAGVGLAKQLNYLIAFKQYTTQVFYDAGNPPPGSPLSVVPDAQIPLGCLSGSSIQQIDNSLLWLSSNQTISPQVIQMDNLIPKVVSTPAIERILDNVTWANIFGNPNIQIRSWVLKHAGHRFYGLLLYNNNISLVYDMDQKAWYIWTDVNGNFWGTCGMAFTAPGGSAEGVHLAQDLITGAVYPLDGDYQYPNDNGVVVPLDLYTPNLDAGTARRKMLSNMYFNADRTSGSILNVRYSDDDYTSWSNFRNVDLSDRKPRLSENGTFKYRRAYHIRHNCDTPLRLRSIDLQIDVGTL